MSLCVRARLTFNYLLGRGVVDLLLGGVGGKDTVEGVHLALGSTTRRRQRSGDAAAPAA